MTHENKQAIHIEGFLGNEISGILDPSRRRPADDAGNDISHKGRKTKGKQPAEQLIAIVRIGVPSGDVAATHTAIASGPGIIWLLVLLKFPKFA
jgi:hypothetical protein